MSNLPQAWSAENFPRIFKTGQRNRLRSFARVAGPAKAIDKLETDVSPPKYELGSNRAYTFGIVFGSLPRCANFGFYTSYFDHLYSPPTFSSGHGTFSGPGGGLLFFSGLQRASSSLDFGSGFGRCVHFGFGCLFATPGPSQNWSHDRDNSRVLFFDICPLDELVST